MLNTIKDMNAPLVAQTVKNLPAMRETWVPSLGWEDPLEEGITTHSSILAWRILTVRGAWWATVHGIAKSIRNDWSTKHSTRYKNRLELIYAVRSQDSGYPRKVVSGVLETTCYFLFSAGYLVC